jgi:hypothetical protein
VNHFAEDFEGSILTIVCKVWRHELMLEDAAQAILTIFEVAPPAKREQAPRHETCRLCGLPECLPGVRVCPRCGGDR